LKAEPVIVAEFGLHYITHKRNLESIRSRGLLSLNEVLRRGLSRADISDQDVQSLRERREPIWNRSIHDYVPLYLNPKNPMLSKRRELRDELVILKIQRGVARSGEVIFCDGNAASAATKFSLDEQILTSCREALRAEYWTGVEDGKRRRMAEVLVHQRVAPDRILAVLCPSALVANEVKTELGLYAVSSPSRFF
jgi:hypothetical protein